MPKYLFEATYTLEGSKGLMEDGGTGRRAAIEQLAKSVGGTLECFYFGFGETDVYTICDLPSDVAAAAVSVRVAAAGGAHVNTIPLLTAEQLDQATKTSVNYDPPGRDN